MIVPSISNAYVKNNVVFFQLDKNMGAIDSRRNQYREELQVAREALSSLRTHFR